MLYVCSNEGKAFRRIVYVLYIPTLTGATTGQEPGEKTVQATSRIVFGPHFLRKGM